MKILKHASYPYFLSVILYLGLTVLTITYSLASPYIPLPFLPNMRWLIVHLVSLGVFTQAIFGALPVIVAGQSNHLLPHFQPTRWLLFNGGLVALAFGIPLVNFTLITAGGTIIFLAVLLLANELWSLRPHQAAIGKKDLGLWFRETPGLPFYLAGLFFLLIGILVGTGLWQGWAGPLHIATPKEVHVHSNLWGYAAMVFAGLLLDLYPQFARLAPAWPKANGAIFWLMAAGSLSMVLGPWFAVNAFTVGGLVLHAAGSVGLLLDLFKPLLRTRSNWSPGVWHLVAASFWFLVAVVIAPLVVARSDTGAEVAGNGGPILIYGWMLQMGYALIPYIFRREPEARPPTELGGNRFSLVMINAGSLLYWLSLLLPGFQAVLRPLGYGLWLLSLLPILHEMWAILRMGIAPARLTGSSQLPSKPAQDGNS